MKLLRLPLLCLSLTLLPAVTNAEEEKSMVIQGRTPQGAFSEQRPDYLHFQEVKVTRVGKQRITFDITLRGEIPANPKESVSYYFGFDIDKDASTGDVAANAPKFGQDVGFYIYQNQGDNRFKVWSNSVEYKGRRREIDVSGLRVKDNKIEVTVRSELFSFFDSFNFFLSATQRIFANGKQVSETQVDTTPIKTF